MNSILHGIPVPHLLIICVLMFALWRDYLTMRLSNVFPILIFISGVIYRIWIHDTIAGGICFLAFFVGGLIIYSLGLGVGGADVKLLSALSLWLPYYHFANMVSVVIIFLFVLAICLGIYGLGIKLLSKDVEIAPMIPIIALSFGISIIQNRYIIVTP